MPALGADVQPLRMVRKAPTNGGFDWIGFYVGAHLGYATGYSNWSATGAAGPSLAGSLDFFRAYDGFKGTGSYFAGLQAGYTTMLPSRVVLGVEADVSFPNLISGRPQVFTSPATGTASYAETMQYFGTVRGRIGYAPAHWMIYATGGFAWSYEQFTRTQISGMPPGGTATPGTVEDLFIVPRIGWTVGGGAEVALPSNWSARVEYLYTDYGSRSVSFPQGAQRFTSDLVAQSVRLGFNYRPGGAAANGEFIAKGPPALEYENFVLHGQTTFVGQYAFPFRVPYRGPHSLDPNQFRETWDYTLYAGLKLWEGAEFWFNPEIGQGFGLSSTLGVAGFPSGEAYKLGASIPYTRLNRMFVRQTIELGGEKEKVEANINQFAGSRTADRLVITVGKFNIADIFDINKYSHDARSDFMNWALIDAGTFDYAGDAWGYNYGAAVEWYQGKWALRAGLFDLSLVPGSTDLDPRFSQFQLVGEIEHRHEIWGQPGKVGLTGYITRGRFGRYADAIQLAQMAGGPADIAAVRQYTTRTGLSLNVEQQLASDLGMFVRAGFGDGNIEATAFTDIDRTAAAGFALMGKRWGRPDDTVGFAAAVNNVSGIHQAFFNAGGLGLLVGDGILPNPGLEKIIETYYSLPISSWRATFDYQFITNPAYNRDRGPVSVIATRLRAQF
jgi:high affinity Mn2+ porin